MRQRFQPRQRFLPRLQTIMSVQNKIATLTRDSGFARNDPKIDVSLGMCYNYLRK